MPKIRKALSAAFAAGLAVILTGLATEIPRTNAGWAALLGSAVGAAAVAGYAVWRVPNVPATSGVTVRSGPAPY
jgi:hypothetical protein